VSTQPEITPHPRPLWAPWRIEYIRAPKTHTCFLCEKAAGENADADHVVHRGETCYVLLNDYPYNSGHLLVAPYRHVAGLADLSDGERNELMALLVQGTAVLQRLMSPRGFNLGFNLGEAAGALAAYCLEKGLTPRQVRNTAGHLSDFQRLLANKLGFVLAWPDYARVTAC